MQKSKIGPSKQRRDGLRHALDQLTGALDSLREQLGQAQ